MHSCDYKKFVYVFTVYFPIVAFLSNQKRMKHMKNLQKIADSHLCGITTLYRNEHRTWWENVNEDEIYARIGDSDFAAEVERIVQDTIGNPVASLVKEGCQMSNRTKGHPPFLSTRPGGGAGIHTKRRSGSINGSYLKPFLMNYWSYGLFHSIALFSNSAIRKRDSEKPSRKAC